jgi:hypothetical protein
MAWKTFDETTAAALKQRVAENAVSVDPQPRPLFDGGDSVVIAPTLQKGAALVIIARKKTTTPVIEEPPAPEPLATIVEDSPAAEEPLASVIEQSPEEVAEPAFAATDTGADFTAANPEPKVQLESTVSPPDEFTFGPTTWERADEVEPLPEPSESRWESRSTDPGIWDIPSQAPSQPWPEESQPQEPSFENAPTFEESRGGHYVASGFLGLDDYAEDEEEIARAKRPWWKRIFTD